jgi:hypothetical protein
MNKKKKSDEVILKEIASIISKFLKGSGGLGNGYKTWADGSVCAMGNGCLKIFTPLCEDLT